MEFTTNRNNNDKKIWMSSQHVMKVKALIDDVVSVIAIDTSNAKTGIIYRPLRIEPKSNVIRVERKGYFDIERLGYEWTSYNTDRIVTNIPDDAVYPYFIYTDNDQTETDEPADETIIFPPPETQEQFFERIYARLLHLTRRIRILRHEEPHQNALSTRICREVPADHEEVLRYDIACNLIKRPVGWLALQLENYQTRYNRHLAAVVKAKEAGRTPPTFNKGSDETKIEAMLEKLETHLTEECLENHFDLHDHAEWDRVQNKQRKITLCDDDYSPGELLVDVNSFFTDGDGNIAETHAKKTYHDISTKYWVKAKRTPHRNLVTERTVEL